MAPGPLLPDHESIRTSFVPLKNSNAPRHIFPDGIRTSGSHPPVYHQLKPYSRFPQHIQGRTLWHKEDYQNDTSRWTHAFSETEIAELSIAADDFIASGTPLTGITKELFPLPTLAKRLAVVRDDILNGKGFILFKKFPADKWGPEKNAVAYMGIGTHLGYFVSQNGRGHVLGHVKDVGDDPTKTDRVRIYRTTARQFFHTDGGDLVGLLCVNRAARGGESDIVSTHAVWNTLQEEYPDVAELLARPIWYFDRKGETSDGEDEWIRRPVFYVEHEGKGRVYCKWDPYYVSSLQRFSDAGLVPPLSDAQVRAMTILEDVCNRLALHMILEVGDIQFLHNGHVLHARTAYEDRKPPHPRRHLLRLWLSTPVNEGGWTMAFPDNAEQKREGIQVNNTPPRAPLDAE